MDMNEELKEGHRLDLVKILSSQQRDYLVRNNGDQVKIESLRGKIVVLYIKELCPEQLSLNTTQDILEAFNQLATKADLEIVFVAKGEDVEDEHLFNKYFSTMPWLAIPYVDLETRMRFVGQYGCALLDENGIVLKTRATDLFISFGASLYPFTKERLDELMSERDEAFEEGTMKSLLSSPSRNYVISNTNEKIPISELEEKIVGLYFYNRNSSSMEWLTPKLVEIYHELKARGENFEIVMINLHFNCEYNDDRRLFEEEFKKMPWLALPFMDQNCRTLYEMFNRWFDTYGLCGMVIIGPGGNILCGEGIAILLRYGIQAYPFTFEAIIEAQISRIKTFTFHSLLVGLGLDVICAKNGAQIQVSDLNGIKIFLFIGRCDCPQSRILFQTLLNWHSKKKDDSFQVIFASSDDDLSSFDSFYKEIPWPTLPFDPKKTRALIQTLGITTSSLLVAFGPDGHILTTYGQTIVEDESVNDDECGLYNDWFDQVHIEAEDSMVLPGCPYFGGADVETDDSEEDSEEDESEDVEGTEDSEEYESEDVEGTEDSEEYESEEMEIDGGELVCC